MSFGKLLDRFVARRPVAVLFRAMLERALSAERMNELFATTAVEQYDHRIAFATVVDVLGEVVNCQQKSVNAAYKAAGKEAVGASIAALYEKLAGVEPAVSEALVRSTANELAAIIDMALPRRKPLLPGYSLRILDGKLLDGTEHRTAPTRPHPEAVLPGRLCAMLDPERELVLDVIACEDGHAAERTLMARMFSRLRPGDCLLADRNYCTKSYVWSLQEQGIKFILRQHAGDCEVELLGPRKRLGCGDTGVVYEQTARVVYSDGRTLPLRRITVELAQQTRDGDREIHLLTNLPVKIGGRRIADLYRQRWRIEQTFQAVAQALRGEVNTLGYPRAALLGYCLALTTFNLLSTVKACIRAAHKEHAPAKLSTYYLADEVVRAWDGLDLMIPAAHWERRFVHTPLKTFVRDLLAIARHVDAHRFATTTRGPKKPRKQLPRGKSTHLSTYRLLQSARQSE